MPLGRDAVLAGPCADGPVRPVYGEGDVGYGAHAGELHNRPLDVRKPRIACCVSGVRRSRLPGFFDGSALR